jgi:group I intron endonuclease
MKIYCSVYKITNNINGKSYTGAHETEDIDDDYMGSGRVIKEAIVKYGIENFSKEILFIADTADEMYDKEKELIEIGPRSYNIAPGGRGAGKGCIGGMLGKKHTEKSKAKTSTSNKAFYQSYRYTAKEKSRHIENARRNAEKIKDTFWWNNGQNNKRSKTCPGLEWKRGRLKHEITKYDTEIYARKQKRTKIIIIDNIEYFSLNEASRRTKLARQTIRSMLVDGRATEKK